MKKKIFCLTIVCILFVTGCGNSSKIREAYDKTQINDNMKGYTLNYSFVDGDKTDDKSVTNYLNKSFIYKRNIISYDKIYVKDGTKYKKEDNSGLLELNEVDFNNIGDDFSLVKINKYYKTDDDVKFLDTNVFFKPLLNASKVKNTGNKNLLSYDCETYSFKISKKYFQDVIEEANYNNCDESITGTVFLTDGHIIKVIYYLNDKASITVYLTDYNNVKDFNIEV